MATLPWYRLDDGFLARLLPRVSRTRVSNGVPPFIGPISLRTSPGDGAKLLRRGLTANLRFDGGRLHAVIALEAAIAARDRVLLRRALTGLPDEFTSLLLRPRSPKSRASLTRYLDEGAGPESALLFFHAGDRKTGLRLLRKTADASTSALVQAARVRAVLLGETRPARGLLKDAEARVGSTFDALDVASALFSVLDDRGGVRRVLEAARSRARTRGGLTRLAWGWGALLGDLERARDLLREADDTRLAGFGGEPSPARDWLALLGDDAAARATLDVQQARCTMPSEIALVAAEWWTCLGDQSRARELLLASPANSAEDQLVIAQALADLKDRAGARERIEKAEELCQEPHQLTQVAEARAKVLHDRKGAVRLFARAIEGDENPYGVEASASAAAEALGALAALKLVRRREARATSFEDHFAFAKLRHGGLPDAKARDRHLAEAARLAMEPHQIRELAAFLRESNLDPERADRLVEDALSKVGDVIGWINLTHYRPADASAYFRRHWPRVLSLAGPGRWSDLITHARGFEDPDLSRLVLEAFETHDADVDDALRAAEEWHELGDPAREVATIERAKQLGAPPDRLAEAWVRAGQPEQAVPLLTRIEAEASNDAIGLGFCAQTWHAAGYPDRARDALERAGAAARESHEHQACATLWNSLFSDPKRAEACAAKMAPGAGLWTTGLPGQLGGIHPDLQGGFGEMSYGRCNPIGF